jgi:hypothetical protein
MASAGMLENLRNVCEKKALIAITGTLPPASVPNARISFSNSNPSIPGIFMSDNTKSGREFFINSRPSNALLATMTLAPN